MRKQNNKKQELGIYYTPEVVVEFVFDILNVLKNKEDKETQRWQSRKPRPHYPSVIDPACGEGIFLKKAIEKGFTKPKYTWGIDIDSGAKLLWERINLLKSFGSKAELNKHFFPQDGLLRLPDIKYRHKLNSLRDFDAVVGNPPYGGIGIEEIDSALEKALYDFDIWKYTQKRKYLTATGPVRQEHLLDQPILRKDIRSKLKKYPIEILFIERFLQLCKPGGRIAIIIPDGILANSTYDYIRQFIAERAKILAIVSLPRETFKRAGTSAKTSILFLQKTRDKLLTQKKDWDYPVFLALVNKLEKQSFDIIIKDFKSFVGKGVLNND